MKVPRQLKLVLTLLAVISSSSAQALQPEFSLHLDIFRNTVAIGSKINGRITLMNTSSHDITVYSDRSRYAHPSGFTINVRDAKGNTPALTDSAQVIIGSGADQIVRAGGRLEYKVDVGNLYHIDNRGVYTVQAQVLDGKTHIVVKSNIVTISVADK